MDIFEIDGYRLFIRHTPNLSDPDKPWTVINESPGRIWNNKILPKEIPQTPASPAKQ